MTAPDRARHRELLDELGLPWELRLHGRHPRAGQWKLNNAADAPRLVEALNALPGLLDALDEAEKERDAAQTAHGELFTTFTETEARLAEAEKALVRIRAVVDAQAEDEGLWRIHPKGKQPIVEAYLQQELRRLHAAVEDASVPLTEQGAEATLRRIASFPTDETRTDLWHFEEVRSLAREALARIGAE